ncbi:MAG: hypothetical protein UFS73_05560 [Weissella confusa]|nr:hypothetical protein [Weissella confusa]
MSLFNTITDGMANAGTYIQQNFEKLAKSIVSIDNTTGEIELGDVKVNNLAVNGEVFKTTNTGTGSGLNWTAYTDGNSIYVAVSGVISASLSSGNAVQNLRIPENYRTIHPVTGAAKVGSSTSATATLSTDGTVSLQVSLNANTPINITFMFFKLSQ